MADRHRITLDWLTGQHPGRVRALRADVHDLMVARYPNADDYDQFENDLAPLTDPGTPAARVDMLFRERAFWLYLAAAWLYTAGDERADEGLKLDPYNADLYDLTSLQRDANRRFGYSARVTLSLAQALYEQHKVLTYPRTDSRALHGIDHAIERSLASVRGLTHPWGIDSPAIGREREQKNAPSLRNWRHWT